jgi:GNAT superfamily N-acetyltransferase
VVNSHACHICPLQEDHLEPALALCRVAGWNQLAADWLRLIRYQPDGCFAAFIDNQLVGTVTTTRYGTELAWIGMMLVDPTYRRCGIATRLMQRSIDFLRSSGVQCIKLDATPVGQTVYERLSFRAESTLHRWQAAIKSDRAHPQQDTDKLTNELIDEHYALDRTAFGVDRRELLDSFAADSIVITKGNAFGMMRRGHLASYLGPVVASRADDARAIIELLLAQVSGNVFWDVLDQNQHAAAFASALGFEQVRELTRMSLAQLCHRPNLGIQYGIADPAVG